MRVNSEDRLTIECTYLNDVAVLACRGEIDMSTASCLRMSIESARELGGPVMLDMALVTFMDSVGLSALLDAGGLVGGFSNPVGVLNPSAAVRRLLKITGLEHVVSPRSTAA